MRSARTERSDNPYGWLAVRDVADDAGARIACSLDHRANGLGPLCLAGNEQTSGSLWIREQGTAPRRKTRRQNDLFAAALPISPGRAGDIARLRERLGLHEKWNAFLLDDDMHAATPRQFETVAKQTEAGHVRQTVHVVILREDVAYAVQQGRRGEHFQIGVVGQRAFLERGRIDPDANSLGQNQSVARPRPGIPANIFGAA